ncbi:hypothetical protein D3C71_1708070 [compost metagenome]
MKVVMHLIQCQAFPLRILPKRQRQVMALQPAIRLIAKTLTRPQHIRRTLIRIVDLQPAPSLIKIVTRPFRGNLHHTAAQRLGYLRGADLGGGACQAVLVLHQGDYPTSHLMDGVADDTR